METATKPLKRNPNLVPLSREHHYGLLFCWKLKQGLANGTDPEILLLIEARKENGVFTWQYAAGRFSDRKLRLNLDDQEVWSVETSTFEDRKGAYFVMNAEKRELPGEAAEEKPIGKRMAE